MQQKLAPLTDLLSKEITLLCLQKCVFLHNVQKKDLAAFSSLGKDGYQCCHEHSLAVLPAIQPLMLLSRTADFDRAEATESFQELRAPEPLNLILGVALQHIFSSDVGSASESFYLNCPDLDLLLNICILTFLLPFILCLEFSCILVLWLNPIWQRCPNQLLAYSHTSGMGKRIRRVKGNLWVEAKTV